MPPETQQSVPPLKGIILSAALFWTFCVILTWLIVAFFDYQTHVKQYALREGRIYIDRAVGLRDWAARHGGVYVPPSETTPPNPYLAHIPDRDLALANGKELTLMNPAYMLRDLQNTFAEKFQSKIRITSLAPLRPANSPEPWERRALQAFAQGENEYIEFNTTAEDKHLRLMQPLITRESCLKCHADKGYQPGDILGGISTTISLSPLITATKSHQIYWGINLGGLWLFGLIGLWFSRRHLLGLLQERDLAHERLAAHKEELEERVRERTASLQETQGRLEKEISERAATQKALEESLYNLDQIFNSAADGISIVAWDYTVLMCNDTFAAMAGSSRDKLVGKKCYEIFVSPCCHTEQCPLALAAHSENTLIQEETKKRPDGREIECQVVVSPFYDNQGNQLGILKSYRDISQRKALEKSLRQEASKNARQAVELRQKNTDILSKNIELEEALHELKSTQSQMLQYEKMASVGQLAAGVAHEINNPTGFVASNLSSLKKYVQRITDFLALLQEAVPAEQKQEIEELRHKMKINQINEDIHDLIAESMEGTERIKKIVMSLKNFSRQDQEEYGPADINECLESTLVVVWNELKYKATVNRQYGELPTTKCYAQQLNQVFMNLLINGAQAIDQQGEITITTWAADNRIFVAVADTGCGMDQETVAHIFDPFFTTKEKGKGTGLGLSIAYDIISKKHHGTINVQSRPGQGTTFTLAIPVVTT
ncbi:MAG: hypothetical protein C0613_02205 [Desulfobulbaceae bacterium]|nr:MAG: hypothetical protein C0613_02205 [Desulfobulbaceae bacterium]